MLQQIIAASEAIRRKYQLIKNEKQASEHALEEVFQPITTPIKELVAASKKGGKRNEKDEALEENLEEASERGDIRTENAYANRLLEMRSRLRKKDLDTALGIRQLDGKGFMFGDQPIRLDRDHVFVGDTPGPA